MRLFKNYGHCILTAFIFIVLFAAGASKATASDPASSVCFEAGRTAAEKHGVPQNVMQAIALTESGRTIDGKFSPWPWTTNFEGRGVWFKSRQQAATALSAQLSRGITNFDVGCFQVNFKWHGHHFSSLGHMIDPYVNANYAASYLRTLYNELQDWTEAAGAYHSRNELPARKYLARFNEILSNIDPATSTQRIPNPRTLQQNSFPLLTGTSTARRSGSLFPKNQKVRRSLLNTSRDRG